MVPIRGIFDFGATFRRAENRKSNGLVEGRAKAAKLIPMLSDSAIGRGLAFLGGKRESPREPEFIELMKVVLDDATATLPEAKRTSAIKA